MSYIGSAPGNKFQSLTKQTFSTSATATYTLDQAVSSVNDIELFLNNVRQEPTTAYTISGTTLTLASAITGSDSLYCVYQGKAVETIAPGSNTVTNDMLAGSIATSKLADITANGITMADQWRLTTSFTGDAGPISSNLERNDSSGYGSIGSAMTESSGTFTFPSTGIYKLDYFLQIQRNAADDNQIFGEIFVVTDGSVNYSSVAHALYGSNYANQRLTVSTSYYFDVTDTSTHKVRFSVSSNSGNNTVVGASTHNATFFNFIRLGDT